MFTVEGTVGRDNICNQDKEIKEIEKAIEDGKRMSLYAPRKHGKTSITKNIIIPEFAEEKGALPIYIDLFKVTDLVSAANRIRSEISKSLRVHLSSAQLIKKDFVTLIGSIGLTVGMDPLTGLPTLSVNPSEGSENADIYKVCETLRRLGEKHKLLLVFDEFQDISFVEELGAVIRTEIQHMTCPMIFLGSRMALLSHVFNDPAGAFYEFLTKEIIWDEITEKDWANYFNQHLSERGSSITKEGIEELIKLSMGVPKTIVEIGDHFYRSYSDKVFTDKSIAVAFEDLSEAKIQGIRFEFSKLSKNDLSVLKALAKFDYFTEGMQSAAFTKASGVPATTTKEISDELLRLGYMEDIPEKGIRVSNPIVKWMLTRYDI